MIVQSLDQVLFPVLQIKYVILIPRRRSLFPAIHNPLSELGKASTVRL